MSHVTVTVTTHAEVRVDLQQFGAKVIADEAACILATDATGCRRHSNLAGVVLHWEIHVDHVFPACLKANHIQPLTDLPSLTTRTDTVRHGSKIHMPPKAKS